MKTRRPKAGFADTPGSPGATDQEGYVLRLYVAGSSSRSLRAIQNARELCDGELAGRCTLEIIDIFQQPARAKDDQIVAVPTLVRRQPQPARRIIGDLSNAEALRHGLDLRRRN